jgi:hypothetical protein
MESTPATYCIYIFLVERTTDLYLTPCTLNRKFEQHFVLHVDTYSIYLPVFVFTRIATGSTSLCYRKADKYEKLICFR